LEMAEKASGEGSRGQPPPLLLAGRLKRDAKGEDR